MRASRIVQAIVILLVLCAFLLRIRPPEGPAPVLEFDEGVEGTDAPGQITIRMSIWGMPWEDRLFEDYYCREFERRNPGVRVRYMRLAGDIVSKYMLWHIRGDGTGADVMRQHTMFFDRLVAAGVNEPLDAYIDDPVRGIDGKEDFVPELWDAVTVDEKIYAVPAGMNQLGLIYNKAIFDAYNREHPDDPLEYPSTSWTWRDLEYAAEKLTFRERGHTEIFGLDFLRDSYNFLCFYMQAGGQIWNSDKNEVLIDSPEGMETIRFWKKMSSEMQIARPNALRDTAMGPDKFFQFGKTAMLIDGSWRIPDIVKQAPDLDFGVVPLPGFRRTVTIGGSTVWAISSSSRNKDVAWEFIKFVTSKEGSMKYWDMLWVSPPSRRSVVFDDSFKSAEGLMEGGVSLTPALRREDFQDKAAWLLDGFGTDPKTGKRRTTLEYMSPHYEMLAARLQVALDRIFLPDSPYDPETELKRCAADVNMQIRERMQLSARGASTRD